MPSTTAEIAASGAILINEASVATGVPARKINRLIDDQVLPRSACVMVGNRRALRAFALPMVGFGATDGAKLSKDVRLDAMRLIERFAKQNWELLRHHPEHATVLRFESGAIVVGLGRVVCEAMAGLNRVAETRQRVAENPGVRGGLPVVRGTRISVYEVADALAVDGMDAVLEDFPSMSRGDVEAAATYAKVHPRTGRPRSGSKRRLVSEQIMDLPTPS